jgi:hypothetical protein
MHFDQITVIIPTLGNRNITKLLTDLTNSVFIKEIIISKPRTKNKNFLLKNKKIKIIYSDIKNQVYQRVTPIRLISNKFLLYLDDDVLLNKNFVNNLYKDAVKSGSRFVLSPCYYDNNKKKIHNLDGNFYFNLKKILHFFLFGVPFGKKRMGFFSKAGSCYGVDPDYMNKEFYKAQWFPGGCFLLPYRMMERNFYFNIRQKSFGEDLLLSHILKKKCSIIVSKKLSIYTEKPQTLNTKKQIHQYLNAHKYLCKKINLNNFYTKIWRSIFLFKSKMLANV